MTPLTELVQVLRENIIAAFERGTLRDGMLAERLIVQRKQTADALEPHLSDPQTCLQIAEEGTVEAALRALVDAKALSTVRVIVAGWNGEGKPDGPYDRHPYRLGARIDTCCGEMYELDEALQNARRALSPKGDGR